MSITAQSRYRFHAYTIIRITETFYNERIFIDTWGNLSSVIPQLNTLSVNKSGVLPESVNYDGSDAMMTLRDGNDGDDDVGGMDKINRWRENKLNHMGHVNEVWINES